MRGWLSPRIVPRSTLKNETLPKVSTVVLKTCATSLPFGSQRPASRRPSRRRRRACAQSAREGSERCCRARGTRRSRLAAAAQTIGTSDPRAVAACSAVRTSSSVSSVPSRYFSRSASSLSAAASTRAACARSISALISAGSCRVGCASAPVELVGTIVDEVDVATESVGRPDRHRNRDRRAGERLTQGVDCRLVRGVLLVHAVHDDERWNAGGLDHLPGHLGAHLHGPGRGDDEHRRVGDRERLDRPHPRNPGSRARR